MASASPLGLVLLGLFCLSGACWCCVYYCSLTPDIRTLCPETEENRPPNRVNSTGRLSALRSAMANSSLTGAPVLQAYIIYESSAYYSDPVTKYDRGVRYLSGFTGSNSYAVVTRGVSGQPDRAALWTDGRYFLQADQQMDCNWILMQQGMAGYPEGPEWLVDVIPHNSAVGADPSMMASDIWLVYEEKLASKNIQLVEVVPSLLDHIWTVDRPPKANENIWVHALEFAGRSWQDKVSDVRAAYTGVADVLVLTALDDVAWLFNMRGSDRAGVVFDSMAILRDNEIRLYLNNLPKLLQDEVVSHLNTGQGGSCAGQTPPCVNCRELSESVSDIAQLSADSAVSNIWINPDVKYDIYKAAGDKRHVDYTPVQLMKAKKSQHERDHYNKCQRRDSATLVEFAAFLEKEMTSGQQWTELTSVERLADMRRASTNYVGGGGGIAAVGSNAAIIHYSPTPETDRAVRVDEVYLSDTGASYLDGNTDVTRVWHFGTPKHIEKEAYTRVLIGSIDLALTVWPEGLKGSDIDGRTRTPLWQNGWDYNHGTGHGIGYCLYGHEGPGRIDIGYNPAHSPLYEGMFLSDEPGYYEPDQYGIRLETIVEVVKANTTDRFNNKQYLTFKPTTLVPFEPKMILYEMLEASHRRWLNAYNKRCDEEVGGLLRDKEGSGDALAWLAARVQHIPDEPSWNPPSTATAASANIAVTSAMLLITNLYI